MDDICVAANYPVQVQIHNDQKMEDSTGSDEDTTILGQGNG